jgi:multidrug efflux pump subunit AcrB
MSGFNLSALAVRERAVTLFLIIALVGAGIFAFLKLGRAEDPAFTVKVLTVAAVWPGATANEMQDQVAEPLEKRLQELKWYDRVETINRPGLTLMTLTLKDSTPPVEVESEFYQARKKLSDESSKLPTGVIGPIVNDEYSDVTFALYSLEAAGQPMRLLARQAETIRQRLLHVDGVKKVNIIGERPERIYVDFSYQRLATLGVSPLSIFEVLQKQNAVTPSGSIETKGAQVHARLDGALEDLPKIRNTPITAQGRMLKLSDVATVSHGYEDPANFIVKHNGTPAVLLGVVMQDGRNGLDLGKALEHEQGEIAASLPVPYAFSKVTDQAVNIASAVDEFMKKFVIALAVVMFVSIVALGWRVGIVVAAAVPLTLAVVFLIMMLTGRVFDRITLGALIIALGLLVDDAIITVEMMVVKMEEGVERVKAAAFAWGHVAPAMLAGTVAIIIGFTPVGFAKSAAGEYAGNIFWIVAFALLASWLGAQTFTPYLGVKLLPNIKAHAHGYESIYHTPRYNKFRRMVSMAVNHKFIVAAIVVILFAISIVGMGAVKQQFFPASDRPEVFVEVQMPMGTAIENTEVSATKVEQWLMKQPEATVVTTYVGQGAPRFFLSYNPELPDPSFAKIIVLTPNAEAREALKHRLRDAVAAGLAPEARVRATQLVFGPYTRFPVEFRVSGPDETKLRDVAQQVLDVMRANPHMRDVNESWGARVPSARFILDQDRLQLMDLSSKEVAEQLQFLLTGAPITQIREDIRSVVLVARSLKEDRSSPAKLQDLIVFNRAGTPISLSQIGRVEMRAEAPRIERRDRVPTITVRGDIDEALQPPQVSMEVMNALKPIIEQLPAGYKIGMGGNIEEAEKANAALAPIFPVMIVLTLLAIMIQARSFSGMTMVALTGPLGLVGTVAILLLFNQPFGFNAILGLIGLSGILMRNTLILIEQIRNNVEDEGMEPYHAVVEATVQRARPVILTALAAVLAFIPLTTSVFWGSMAFTLIGGTAVGTVLTLFFLPSLYSIWYKVKPPKSKDPKGAEPDTLAPAA